MRPQAALGCPCSACTLAAMRWVSQDCSAMSQPVRPPSAPPPPSPPATANGRGGSCASARRRRRGPSRESKADPFDCPIRHGHATMAALAILKPKLVPGERLVKNDSVSFCLSVSSIGLGLATVAAQPEGGGDELHRILIVEFKVDEIFGIGDAQGQELDHGRRSLQRQGDVELDQMVGPLLHPIVGDRAEIHRLAADLQGREIADVGQAACVLLRQRGELLALDQFARRGESLGGEGRIHFVENPIVDDRGNLPVGREGDLALDGYPDMRMRGCGRRRRQSERQHQRRNSPSPQSVTQKPVPFSPPAHPPDSSCGQSAATRWRAPPLSPDHG